MLQKRLQCKLVQLENMGLGLPWMVHFYCGHFYWVKSAYAQVGMGLKLLG